MESNRIDETKLSVYTQEILKSMPHWFFMSGNIIISVFLLVFLSLSWFIKYPDIVIADVVLVSEFPPIGHYSRSDGQVHFFIKNGDLVTKGQNMALIENNANFKDVQHIIPKIKIITADSIPSFSNKYILGEIQPKYNEFINAVSAYFDNIEFNPLFQETKGLRKRISRLIGLLEKQKSNKENYLKDSSLLQNSFSRNKKLYEKGVISLLNLESSEREYLAFQRLLKNSEIEIDQSLLNIAELRQRILEIQTQMNLQSKKTFDNLSSAKKNLEEAISDWELKYLIQSSIDGKVSLFEVWSNKQYVKAGDEIVVVIPESQNKIKGKAKMPLVNSGKVKKGQKVIIKLDNYNAAEFGSLIGNVRSISSVPRNNTYLVNLELPDGFKTSYNKTIEFDQEVTGKAEIITDDIRLIERYFYQLRKIFSNQ